MAPNFWPILILLATVVAATSTTSFDGHPPHNDNVTNHDYGTCREHDDDACGEDSKNDVVVSNEESVVPSLAGEEREMQVHALNRESEFIKDSDQTNHRMLVKRDRYISYRALAANNIFCGWKGSTYYNCSYRQRANPYRRGCTEATGCYRYTH